MRKIIAVGTIKETETLKIVGSVAVDILPDGTESQEVGAHYVTLEYKDMNADAQPMDAFTFADIVGGGEESGAAASDGALVVPGLNGHADVELASPFAVRYTKTKSFVRKDGKVQVIAMLRYEY